jgi:WD40 repeat protein
VFDTVQTQANGGETKEPKFLFMDSFNLLDYITNGFTEAKRTMTTDHYYSTSQQRKTIFNHILQENSCNGIFAHNDLNTYICYIRQCQNIFFRNFALHQVVKRIELDSLPRQIEFSPTSHFFYVLQADNVIKMIDSVNEENTSSILTIHEEAKTLTVCPNGKYLITGGSKGDICIWAVNRAESAFSQH